MPQLNYTTITTISPSTLSCGGTVMAQVKRGEEDAAATVKEAINKGDSSSSNNSNNNTPPRRKAVQAVVLSAPLKLEGDDDDDGDDYRAPNILQRVLGLLKNVRPGTDLTRFQVTSMPHFSFFMCHVMCVCSMPLFPFSFVSRVLFFPCLFFFFMCRVFVLCLLSFNYFITAHSHINPCHTFAYKSYHLRSETHTQYPQARHVTGVCVFVCDSVSV